METMRTLAVSLAFVLLLLSTAVPALGAGFPSADPGDDARLLGGEVLAYQLDADDLDALYVGSVTDRSPWASHGTRLNGVQTVAGPNGFGTALRGDGTGQYVRVDDLAGVDALTDEVTVAAWVRPESFSGNRVIFSSFTADGHRQVHLYLQNGPGDVVVQLSQPGGGWTQYDFAAGPSLDTWSHLAVVATSTSVAYLRDGETVNVLARAEPGLFTASPVTNARVMQPTFCCYNSFLGALDEVRVYDRALTNAEVQDVATLPYFHPNTAPVADAGADVVAACTGPATGVTLDASASSDAEGDPLGFAWASADALALADPASAVTGATFPVGVSTAAVTVDDGEFADTDEVTVTVVDGSAPVVASTFPDAPGVYSGDAYLPVGGTDRVVVGHVDVSAAAEDLCGAVDHVRFEVDDGTVVVDAAAPYGFTYAPVGAGVQYRTLSVVAVDDAGNASPPTVVELTVLAAAAP